MDDPELLGVAVRVLVLFLRAGGGGGRRSAAATAVGRLISFLSSLSEGRERHERPGPGKRAIRPEPGPFSTRSTPNTKLLRKGFVESHGWRAKACRPRGGNVPRKSHRSMVRLFRGGRGRRARSRLSGESRELRDAAPGRATSASAAHARRRRNGHGHGGLHRLLPVRERHLAFEQPDPARPAALGHLRRAPPEEPRPPPRDPRPPRGGQVRAGRVRRTEARRLLRRVHGRGGDRDEGPLADRAGARPNRRDQGPRRAPRRDHAPAEDGRQRALHFRLRGGPQGIDASDRRAPAGGAGAPRPRLLHEDRREIGRAPDEVRRPRPEDARARRFSFGDGGRRREGDPGLRDEARAGLDEQRGLPRSGQDPSPDDDRRALAGDAEPRVGGLLHRPGPSGLDAVERLAARLLPGRERPLEVRSPPALEDLPALAPGLGRRADALEEVRGRELRLLRQDAQRHAGEPAALEALRDRDGQRAGDGPRTHLREGVLPARGEEARRRARAEPAPRPEGRHPDPRLDERGDEKGRGREGRDVLPEDRIPREVARLLDAHDRRPAPTRPTRSRPPSSSGSGTPRRSGSPWTAPTSA